MPRYDYRCETCGRITEISHGFDATHEGSCPQCDGMLVRVIGSPVVHYKGYGFFRTDNRSAGEKYAFDHFDGSGDNPEKTAMRRRIKDPASTVPNM